MVCDALVNLDEWRALEQTERELLFAASLLHDVAKPFCTKLEEGRITSRGHSQRGAIEARRVLWEQNANIVLREQLCAMVRYHQMPFFLIQREDAQRMALMISQQIRCDYLAMLAKADALGRLCANQEDLLTNISLFAEYCLDLGCLNQPWPFPTPMSRFEYFRSEDRDPNYRVHDDSKCEVIMMSGLPGSGKDTWLRKYAPRLPVISLDKIRTELGAGPTGNQGEVIQVARERARAFLRTGKSFAWNATNLTRDTRSQLIDLFTDYHARTRIVHVEVPYSELLERNATRDRVVTRHAIERMIDRWDVPNSSEAPIVEWWEDSALLLRTAEPEGALP
jgi:predicted kinase